MERKEKLVKRYLPVEVFDMAGLTEWFSAMAAQGLHLVKLSENRAQFRPGPPKAGVRYALDVSTCYDIEPERNENYAQMGWDYVTTLHGMYYVYRSKDPSAPGLHTDPVTQGGTLTKLIRRQRRALPLSLACMAFIMRDELRTLFTAPWSVPQFIILNTERALLWLVLTVTWLLLVLLPTLRQLRKLKQLRRQLLDGIPLEECRRWQRLFPPVLLVWGPLVLMAAVLAVYAATVPRLTRGLSGPEEWTFPHVTVEQALDGSGAHDITIYGPPEMLIANTRSSSLLCPEQYDWTQIGSAQLGDSLLKPAIFLDFYRTYSERTAEVLLPALKSELERSLEKSKRQREDSMLGLDLIILRPFEALSRPGLDELFRMEYRTGSDPVTYCYLGRKGDQVFKLILRDVPDPEACLDSLVEQMD